MRDDIIQDPNIVYDQYQAQEAANFEIPPIPGSTAITVINGITGPTINFTATGTGLSFGPAGTDVNLSGVLNIAHGGTGATTVTGILTAIGIAKQNSAIIAPTVADDSSAGYSVNSLWTDTVLDDLYGCVDASVGAAVWKKLSP